MATCPATDGTETLRCILRTDHEGTHEFPEPVPLPPFDLAVALRTALAHDITPAQALASMPGVGALAEDSVSHPSASTVHSPSTFTVRTADGKTLYVTVRSDHA